MFGNRPGYNFINLVDTGRARTGPLVLRPNRSADPTKRRIGLPIRPTAPIILPMLEANYAAALKWVRREEKI